MGRNDYKRDYRPDHYGDGSTGGSGAPLNGGGAAQHGGGPTKNGADKLSAMSGLEKQLNGVQQEFAAALHKISEKENEKFDLIFAILSELQSRQAELEESVRSLKAMYANGGGMNGGMRQQQYNGAGNGSNQNGQWNGPMNGHMNGQMNGQMGGMQQFGQQMMQMVVVQSPLTPTGNAGMQYGGMQMMQPMQQQQMQPMQMMQPMQQDFNRQQTPQQSTAEMSGNDMEAQGKPAESMDKDETR
jgi:hypothetical protein